MPVPAGGIHGSNHAVRPRRATVRSTAHSFRTDLPPNVMGGGPTRRLKLEEGARVLSSIPSVHHVIDGHSTNVELRITSHDCDVGACRYEFRPVDPIGWVMTTGSSSKDRFADDRMSSTWP